MSESQPDIYSFLHADSTIAGIVGTRIFPLVLDEGADLPALTYQVIDVTEEQTIEGTAANPRHMRLQVDCWAMSYASIVGLSWEVRRLFDGFQGNMGSVYVQHTERQNLIDSFEPDRKQYRRTLDFIVHFNA